MSKIERAYQKIFASGTPNIGQIGSLRLGTKVKSTDLTTLQALSAFLTGMSDIVKSDSLLLSEEELNALFYLITSQLAYIFQDGIPVYEGNTPYYTNSIVRQPSTTILYKSKTENNTGNLLTDGTHWQELGDLSSLANEYADLDLSNINNSGKNESIEWGLPDYSAGISLAFNTDITITKNGWVSVFSNNVSGYFFINGVLMMFINTNASNNDSNCAIYPVSAGDIVKLTNGQIFTFFPSKGAS